MKKSIFTTRLKNAMKTKDKFEEYNGKRRLLKRYTQTDLANDLGYSVDTIKRWTKTNGSLPPLETLRKLAKLLNVDTAYLLGEQECKHHEEQTICDITLLNEQSADTLTNLNEFESEVLNSLINHPNFKTWLYSVYDFTHSHNIRTTTHNVAFMPNSERTGEEHIYTKNALKYQTTDLLGNMLEDIYTQNTQEENKKLAIKEFAELIYLIDDMIIQNTIYFDEKTQTFQTRSHTDFTDFVQKQLAHINALTNNKEKLYQYEPSFYINNISLFKDKL